MKESFFDTALAIATPSHKPDKVPVVGLTPMTFDGSVAALRDTAAQFGFAVCDRCRSVLAHNGAACDICGHPGAAS